MKQSVNLAFALLGILFCVCLTLANILEVKIVSVGALTITAGLIVFPISYIINDCVAEVWGLSQGPVAHMGGVCGQFHRRGLYPAGHLAACGIVVAASGGFCRLVRTDAPALPWPVSSHFWWGRLSMPM